MLVRTFTLVGRVLGQSHVDLGLELVTQVTVLENREQQTHELFFPSKSTRNKLYPLKISFQGDQSFPLDNFLSFTLGKTCENLSNLSTDSGTAVFVCRSLFSLSELNPSESSLIQEFSAPLRHTNITAGAFVPFESRYE